jgi:NAD(P)-dependent dehydrogenase (short-subunit alcohol dehydrogenase family)
MIVITGASDGLGLQIAKVYKEAGKRVVNVSRRASKCADNDVLTDLTDAASVASAAEAILAIDEPLEVLVNCAGVMSLEPLDKITASELDRTFGVNVRGAILLVSGLAERARRDGTDIVNVASTVGLKAYPEQAAYGASKWAMRGFSQNLQVELKTTNRVMSFCVGGFKSDIAKKVHGQDLPDPENWMDPEDIVVFLKQIIDLPRSMEVSEIVINRRPAN